MNCPLWVGHEGTCMRQAGRHRFPGSASLGKSHPSMTAVSAGPLSQFSLVLVTLSRVPSIRGAITTSCCCWPPLGNSPSLALLLILPLTLSVALTFNSLHLYHLEWILFAAGPLTDAVKLKRLQLGSSFAVFIEILTCQPKQTPVSQRRGLAFPSRRGGGALKAAY